MQLFWIPDEWVVVILFGLGLLLFLAIVIIHRAGHIQSDVFVRYKGGLWAIYPAVYGSKEIAWREGKEDRTSTTLEGPLRRQGRFGVQYRDFLQMDGEPSTTLNLREDAPEHAGFDVVLATKQRKAAFTIDSILAHLGKAGRLVIILGWAFGLCMGVALTLIALMSQGVI